MLSFTTVSLPTIMLIGLSLFGKDTSKLSVAPHVGHRTCQGQPPAFLVVAGGSSPRNTEIALEKNVLYFQRTLRHLGYSPASATVYFANGNSRQPSVRYIDSRGRQQFKLPQIPNLNGASTPANIQQWFQRVGRSPSTQSIFFYFTGHGDFNQRNPDNNALMLWNNQYMTVQELATLLDQLPANKPIVTMMAQCYSGSFANFVYQGGNPRYPLATQSRCGFFATIKTLPSVGCTPAVNEADYRDYSSSFFAGLSGRSRTGQAVASADYDRDGRVSYAEAHAFAKVDEFTTDLPVSTSEVWLQERASEQEIDTILDRSIADILLTARPEQYYVVTALLQKFNLSPQQSYRQASDRAQIRSEEEQAYLVRLGMELVNIAMEQKIRAGTGRDVASLDKLLKCERGSWSTTHAE
ncbi:MAG: C13 family peptidase [Cyanobacteria bacterium]|nr:C13 family peptidase [Cyanobacteriota bacterium]MDW8200481.1 Caspase domain-containing protein [Cyanobacteriota bacterium SKYGB_h_bin112]